jgi:hypothetical protein
MIAEEVMMTVAQHYTTIGMINMFHSLIILQHLHRPHPHRHPPDHHTNTAARRLNPIHGPGRVLPDTNPVNYGQLVFPIRPQPLLREGITPLRTREGMTEVTEVTEVTEALYRLLQAHILH